MALINCPECGKEVSDQSDYCIYCGYPIKQKQDKTLVEIDNETKEEVIKVEAYDVLLLEYYGFKLLAKTNLAKICEITSTQANDILSELPCFIYDDITKEEAEDIAHKLMLENFRVAVYDPSGNVRYYDPPIYSNRPLPILVPAPRRKRYVLPMPKVVRPRPIRMPKSIPALGVGLKSVRPSRPMPSLRGTSPRVMGPLRGNRHSRSK